MTNLPAIAAASSRPLLHELLVPATDEHPTYGYVVVEVTPSSFLADCEYIDRIPWLDNGMAPLVVSHFPLSELETRILPRRVPWLRVFRGVEAQLEALHTALVVPLQQRGMICVDFAEFVVALARGGEGRLEQASGLTVLHACDDLFSDPSLRDWLSGADMAVSLHIRFDVGLDMSELDFAGRRLESLVAEESLVVLSAAVRDGGGDGIELTLLAFSRRSDGSLSNS